jgi:simple sugar transport system permease protein
MKLTLSEQHRPLAATIGVFVLLVFAASMRYTNFFSAANFLNILSDLGPLGVVAVGMTFVILSGGIDLSVGAVYGLTTVVIGRLIILNGFSPLVGIAVGLLVGALFGAGQGALIQFFRLPPFLVTLAGMFLARGVGYIVSVQGGENGGHSDVRPFSLSDQKFYEQAGAFSVPLGNGEHLRLTGLTLLLIVLAAMQLAHLTRFGRNIYAIGGNEQSASLMGLPVGRTKIGVYLLSGLLAALGGVLYTINTPTGDASAGMGLELDAIAAAVVGGTLLTGGVGTVAGTLIGVLIVGIIQVVPNFETSLNSAWTRIAIGVLLFAFIAMQRVIGRLSGARK